MSAFPTRADPERVVTTNAGGIATLRLVDQAGANGLGSALVGALLHALDGVAADPEVRAVVLCGREDWFCSGATREVLAELRSSRLPPTELVLARRLLDLPVPVVAAASGAALGGGLALLFAADLVVLASDRRYGANFLDLGITPGMGTTRLLEHALSPALAHELLLTAASRKGSELVGLAHVVPSARVEEVAHDLAFRIAGHDRRAVGLLKRTLTLPRRRALEEAFTLEGLMHEITLPGLDLDALGDRR
ncbi:MAG: enoyl-CoA hydratase/isomerase family protein [Alphaproteobacteria bacterium]|nr:enoyl-CoA hydratase/isomerase family protein [Alphaproteobacteria bacterium]